MNKKVILGISKLFISLVVLSTLMSSCVQSDLYDLYEDDVNNTIIRRKNKGDYNGGKTMVPGATASNNPPDCAFNTLNEVLYYILGFDPYPTLVSSVCSEVGYGGIYTLRNALIGVITYYCEDLDLSSLAFDIKSPTSQTSYSEWDVVKTYSYKSKVDEWPDSSHVFVVQSTCTISTSDFQNVHLPNNSYVMYGGAGLLSKSDNGKIKYHKDWIEKYISGAELTSLRNTVQAALNK